MGKIKKKIINITTNKRVGKTLAKYNGDNKLFYIKFLKILFVLLKL